MQKPEFTDFFLEKNLQIHAFGWTIDWFFQMEEDHADPYRFEQYLMP